MRIIDIHAEVFADKTMVALVFEIGGSIYAEMALIKQDTTVLLQIIVLGSKIRCLGSVVFLLVLCLVDVVFENEYLWILYHRFW